MADEVRADEAGSASDKHTHGGTQVVAAPRLFHSITRDVVTSRPGIEPSDSF
jgi:hypothetical protein